MKKILLLILCMECLLLPVYSRKKEEKEFSLSNSHFFLAIDHADVRWGKRHLEAGFNANYCKGEIGWYVSDPLKVVMRTSMGCDKYDKLSPNAEVIELLISYGADFNRYPYV